MFLSGEAGSQGDGSGLSSYISEHLERNQIGEKGCKGLSRGNWPSLKTICIGSMMLTKVTTSWRRREWPIYPRRNGERSITLN